MPPPTRSSRLFCVLACVLVLAACSSDTGSNPIETDTEAEAATPTPVPTTAPETPAPADDTAGPAGNGVTSSSAPPVAAGEPAAAAGDQLVLHPEGLGNAKFGDAPDVVIAAVSRILGEPDADTGWHEQSELQVYAACPGIRNRRVDWGQFIAVFTDGLRVSTPYAPAGEEHFFLWAVRGETRQTPAAMADGIGLDSTLTELRATYGAQRVKILPGQDIAPLPDFAVVGNGDTTLMGELENDRVVELEAGAFCGE